MHTNFGVSVGEVDEPSVRIEFWRLGEVYETQQQSTAMAIVQAVVRMSQMIPAPSTLARLFSLLTMGDFAKFIAWT